MKKILLLTLCAFAFCNSAFAVTPEQKASCHQFWKGFDENNYKNGVGMCVSLIESTDEFRKNNPDYKFESCKKINLEEYNQLVKVFRANSTMIALNGGVVTPEIKEMNNFTTGLAIKLMLQNKCKVDLEGKEFLDDITKPVVSESNKLEEVKGGPVSLN